MRFCLLTLVLFGCADEKTEVSTAPAPAKVVAPAAVIPVDPTYDTTFATAEGVAQWETDVNTALDAYVARPPITDATKWLGIYKPEPRTAPVQDYGMRSWDVPTSYPNPVLSVIPNASAVEAKRLEDADQKWPAGLMYLQLGDTASAKRCAQKLLDEGSNIAAAQISVRTGDTAVLDAAVDKLLAADYITKLREEVVDEAVWYGEIDMAMRVVERAGWNLFEEIEPRDIRSAALRGNTAPLVTLIESELAEANAAALTDERYPNLWPDDLIADVATLSRKDRAKALTFARRILEMPSANVVAAVHCPDGCDLHPMTGTFELYGLVKSDAQMHAQYLERTRQWLRQTGASKEESVGAYVAVENPGYAIWDEIDGDYLERVRKTGDAEFVRIWEQALAFSEDPFDTQMMRRALGLSVNPKADGLTPADRYVLAWLTKQPLPDVSGFAYGEVTVYEGGSQYDHTTSYSGCDDQEGATSLGCLLSRMETHGSPDPAKLKAAATDLGLVLSKDDGLRVRAEELDLTRQTIEQLGRQGPEACTLSVRLARSGHGEPNTVHDCDGQDRVDLAWLLVDRDASALERLVADAVRERMQKVIDERHVAHVSLLAALERPFAVRASNKDAFMAPNTNEVAPPRPADITEANALVAPLLDAVRTKAPQVFHEFVVNQRLDHNPALYDAEVARLTAANDVASLAALTNEKAAARSSGSLDPR